MTHETIELLLDSLRLRGGPDPAALAERWSHAECGRLPELLGFEGAPLWFYRRIQQLGGVLPDPVASALRLASHEATVANLRIDAVAASVLEVLAAAGIPVILIKGQARRALAARYPFADAKRLSDVDLLLPEEQVDQGWELLRSGGFEPTYGWPSPFHTPHHRPALHDERGVTVELHLSTALTLSPAVAWQRHSAGSETVTWENREVRVPGATELVWQALVHGVEDETKGWRLRAFLDVAAVLAAGVEVDWEMIEERVSSAEVRSRDGGVPIPPERIHRWLSAAAELAGRELPPLFRTPSRAALVRTLAWRVAVLARAGNRSVRERLLEEGARVEAGLPLSPSVAGTGLLRRSRRVGSSLAARFLYRSWSATLA